MGSVALKEESKSGLHKLGVKKAVKQVKKTQKVIDLVFKTPEVQSFLSEQEKEDLVIEFRMKARKLARSILRKWHARLELQEVDSVVDLSLCEAVKRFNPKMGASFMTFLFYHLRGNLIRAVSSAASAHMMPSGDFETNTNKEEGAESYRNSGRGLNAIEIAEALCGNDYPMPDELVLKKELIDLSQRACSKLDDLAKEVISRIYIQGQQLIDIANSLGYSRCHISRVKKKALEALYTDLTDLLGAAAADLPKPNFDEDDYDTKKKGERRKIFRRRPRSKKSNLSVVRREIAEAH